MDGPILGMLDDGERFEASAVRVAGAREGEEWVMVAASPKAKVWTSVGAVDLDTGKVRGEPAFLRAGPGVLCPAVGQAPRGMRVDVSDRLGVWLRIESPPACVIGYVRALQTRKAGPHPPQQELARASSATPRPVRLRCLDLGKGSLGTLEARSKEVNFAPWLGREIEVEVDDPPQGRSAPVGISRVRRIVGVR